MCGFLGVYSSQVNAISESDLSAFRSSFQRLAHRGNSSHGEEIFPHASLFHHRLAFRDLSEGKQPLTDVKKQATIIFNGELYDFLPLRNRLAKQFDFRTRSDTEVILAAYLILGENFLTSLDGEYAFVIFDHRSKKIVAARDPFGVKPLFWSTQTTYPELESYSPQYDLLGKNKLYFSSEIKGLPIPLHWNTRSHARAMTSLYEEMATAFEGVYQLAPGSLFIGEEKNGLWKLSLKRKVAKSRSSKPDRSISFEQRAQELKSLMEKTVRAKAEADVPLGAYLSGGIDSRIAAHEMSKLGEKIETFTVGFEGADYDESSEVKKFLAKFPNFKGRVLRTSNSALEYAYPHAIYASELVQPYTNGSAKWWLSRFARKYVRGVLTGDGSDEIFCGYPSYKYMAWRDFYQKHPSRARAALYEARVVGKKEKFWEKGLSSLPDGSDLDESRAILGWEHPLFAQISSLTQSFFGNKSSKFFSEEKNKIYSYLKDDEKSSHLTQWQNYFLHTHFPTHVLNWVGDRMEMANTLEGRPIFLSHGILEFMRKLPDGYLVRGMRDKAILRKAYEVELKQFALTPKKQFNAPFLWNSELGREFLNESSLKEAGLIDPSLVALAKENVVNSQNALEKSFQEIFLQNCLVSQMLHRYLVQGNPPQRDLNFEEKFLAENTENL